MPRARTVFAELASCQLWYEIEQPSYCFSLFTLVMYHFSILCKDTKMHVILLSSLILLESD